MSGRHICQECCDDAGNKQEQRDGEGSHGEIEIGLVQDFLEVTHAMLIAGSRIGLEQQPGLRPVGFATMRGLGKPDQHGAHYQPKDGPRPQRQGRLESEAEHDERDRKSGKKNSAPDTEKRLFTNLFHISTREWTAPFCAFVPLKRRQLA